MVVFALDDLDVTLLELLEELAARLQLTSGKRKIEVVFVEGRVVDFHFHGRTPVEELRCSCRKGAWNPSCSVHVPTPLPD
jgi:hypothetical protein